MIPCTSYGVLLGRCIMYSDYFMDRKDFHIKSKRMVFGGKKVRNYVKLPILNVQHDEDIFTNVHHLLYFLCPIQHIDSASTHHVLIYLLVKTIHCD